MTGGGDYGVFAEGLSTIDPGGGAKRKADYEGKIVFVAETIIVFHRCESLISQHTG
jgi:hypothetical protein